MRDGIRGRMVESRFAQRMVRRRRTADHAMSAAPPKHFLQISDFTSRNSST